MKIKGTKGTNPTGLELHRSVDEGQTEAEAGRRRESELTVAWTASASRQKIKEQKSEVIHRKHNGYTHEWEDVTFMWRFEPSRAALSQ